MSSWRFLACFVVVAVLLTADFALATYRKPPFNGSIFGKRGNTAGKRLKIWRQHLSTH